MAKTIGIGHQDFEDIRKNHYFYVDKTNFIREWWENGDAVTLITRPRRFGKTLNISMLEKFFSVKYAGRSELFEGLSVWEDARYRKIQGTYPVLALSFAGVKENSFQQARKQICQLIVELYRGQAFLLQTGCLNEQEKQEFSAISVDMENYLAASSLKKLSDYLSRYYGKKVILLLDEYDTPMQEAFISGYWEELAAFLRSLFNMTFKTNPYLERAVMTGITRVSRESIFSDLNNLEVVTTTSKKYADCFGFTEQEVFAALDAFGLSDRKEEVKRWYDGFTFGDFTDIYNPWSVINYLDKGKLAAYWANTSSNSLVSKLLQEGSPEMKKDFEQLLGGHSIRKTIDEQIVFSQLSKDENAVWSLLLASGYLRVAAYEFDGQSGEESYQFVLTNKEVQMMFANMVRGWFTQNQTEYQEFLKALLQGDLDAMNDYMNRVALTSFSYFDTGKGPAKEEPERFYHGFVLGLLVELTGRYRITSNRESGFGRYDVILEPQNARDDAIILEFKVRNPRREKSLEETVQNALKQIEEKQYAAELISGGLPKTRIRAYGFAFEGKKVLIGSPSAL
ncbi:MAG: AAA family ATPase [Eubacteriales bacterium]|nr:AAA family ATPase [Eubacteriales bacterium]